MENKITPLFTQILLICDEEGLPGGLTNKEIPAADDVKEKAESHCGRKKF